MDAAWTLKDDIPLLGRQGRYGEASEEHGTEADSSAKTENVRSASHVGVRYHHAHGYHLWRS